MVANGGTASTSRSMNLCGGELLQKQSELQSEINTLKSDVEMLVFDQIGDFLDTGTIVSRIQQIGSDISTGLVPLRDQINTVLHETESRFKYEGSDLSLYLIQNTLQRLSVSLGLPRQLKKCVFEGDLTGALLAWYDQRHTLSLYKQYLPQLNKVESFCEEYVRMISVQALQHHFITDGDRRVRIRLANEGPFTLLESFKLSLQTSCVILWGIGADLLDIDPSDIDAVQNSEEEMLVVLRSLRHKVESICLSICDYCKSASLPCLNKIDPILLQSKVLDMIHSCILVHRGDLRKGYDAVKIDSFLLDHYTELQSVFRAVLSDWFDNSLLSGTLRDTLLAIGHIAGFSGTIFSEQTDQESFRRIHRPISLNFSLIEDLMSGESEKVDVLLELKSETIVTSMVNTCFVDCLHSSNFIQTHVLPSVLDLIELCSSPEDDTSWLPDGSHPVIASVAQSIFERLSYLLEKVAGRIGDMGECVDQKQVLTQLIQCLQLGMCHLIDQMCWDEKPFLQTTIERLGPRATPRYSSVDLLTNNVDQTKQAQWGWIEKHPWDSLFTKSDNHQIDPYTFKTPLERARYLSAVCSLSSQLREGLFQNYDDTRGEHVLNSVLKVMKLSMNQMNAIISTEERHAFIKSMISVIGGRSMLQLTSHFISIDVPQEMRPTLSNVDNLRLSSLNARDVLLSVNRVSISKRSLMRHDDHEPNHSFLAKMSFVMKDKVEDYATQHQLDVKRVVSDHMQFYKTVLNIATDDSLSSGPSDQNRDVSDDVSFEMPESMDDSDTSEVQSEDHQVADSQDALNSGDSDSSDDLT